MGSPVEAEEGHDPQRGPVRIGGELPIPRVHEHVLRCEVECLAGFDAVSVGPEGVAAAVVCTVNWDYIPAVLWESFLLALLYLFAALGVCGLISSISPGSNVSFVVCLLLMVVALFYFQNVSFGTEPWYVLGYDSRIIANHVMGVGTVFDGSMSTTDYQPLLSTASVMMCTYGAVTSVVSATLFRYRQI